MTRPYEGLTATEWYEKGRASLQSGQYREAIEAFTKALALDPKYAVAYRNRGNAHSQLGNYQQAVTDYGKALILDPNFVAAYYNRRIAYYRLGNDRQAIEDMKSGARLGDEGTQNFLRSKGISW